MSLDTVEEDIRDEARAQAKEILSEAEQTAEEIIADAEAEAEQIREEREAETTREIEQEREQKVSSAKLEAKQARLEARRDVLEDVRAEVEQAVADLEDGREELTRALLADAAAEFDDGATVEVYGRTEDQELLASLVEEPAFEGFEVGGEVDCLGGVVCESQGSRVRVRNTFDSVLDEIWEDNLKDVTERLFEQ